MSKDSTVRWGVIGTARIANKVVQAIADTDRAEVIAVASRDLSRAEAWGRQRGIPRAYEGYQALLDDDDVDAVYIPLPPSMHCEWTIRAAEHGKHVLCEKPLAMNADQAKEMIAACREHQRQLMDATMWVHSPRAADMMRPLRDGTLGQLRRVTSAFGLQLDSYLGRNPSYLADGSLASAKQHEIRLQKEMGGGALGDLGWYCVRATLWAFGGMPQRVFATARYLNEVDFNLSTLLWYDDDRMASFDCGYDMNVRKWFEVVGTQGSLVCDDFVGPWDLQKSRHWLHTEIGQATEVSSDPRIQEQCMVEEFSRLVREGQIDDQWPTISLQNQLVCDAIAKSARSETIVELR